VCVCVCVCVCMRVQLVRRLHAGVDQLVGIPCSLLCNEVGILAAMFDVSLISAGGCLPGVLGETSSPTLVEVVPGETLYAKVSLTVIQQFRQVSIFTIYQCCETCYNKFYHLIFFYTHAV